MHYSFVWINLWVGDSIADPLVGSPKVCMKIAFQRMEAGSPGYSNESAISKIGSEGKSTQQGSRLKYISGDIPHSTVNFSQT